MNWEPSRQGSKGDGTPNRHCARAEFATFESNKGEKYNVPAKTAADAVHRKSEDFEVQLNLVSPANLPILILVNGSAEIGHKK